MTEALNQYVSTVFGGLGMLIAIAFVAVVVIALTYAVVRR